MTKKYRVEITRIAEQDIDAIRRFIAHDKPSAVSKRVREIRRQAKSLARFPERHEVIQESTEC